MPNIRFTIIDNSNQSKKMMIAGILSSDATCEEYLATLIKLSSQKMRYKVKGIFNANGEKVTTENVDQLGKDDFLICVKSATEKPVISREVAKTVAISKDVPINLIAENTNVCNEAIKQLHNCAKNLEDVQAIAGMPDLHPGTGYPIGAVVATQTMVHPVLIGSDIGCGMTMFDTGKTINKNTKGKYKFNQQLISFWLEHAAFDDANALTDYLIDITRRSLPIGHDSYTDSDSDSDRDNNNKNSHVNQEFFSGFLNYITELEKESKKKNKTIVPYINELGTIGGGNHFAEIQVVDNIHNEQLFKESGFNEDHIYLLIHSGSRNLGKSIKLKNQAKSLKVNSSEFEAYKKQHDFAVEWAKVNRTIIADKVMMGMTGIDNTESWYAFKSLGISNILLDVTHNFIKYEKDKNLWIHRKGSTPITGDYSIIPGSRGSCTYLVKTIKKDDLEEDEQDEHHKAIDSIAHGAGRYYDRNRSKAVSGKYYPQNKDLVDLPNGNTVLCDDVVLMREEIPEAYKDIESVIGDLRKRGLINVVATFKPSMTIKK